MFAKNVHPNRGNSMKKLQTLDEVMQALLAYSPPGMKGKYSLDRMRRLMAFLGDPQNDLRVIHVAGTSGKTSTAYFVRALLETAGQRTGLTVSPHIVSVAERVQIGGAPLPAERFLDYTNQFLKLVAQTGLKPTYFELLIALAYWVFAQEKVDYAVVETGLGGLLDGTNVVARPDKVCVITDIGLDHTEILGDTLGEIAAQKAGVIQPHNHVLVRQQTPEIMDVIARAALKQQATVQSVSSVAEPSGLPPFQRRNWALAEAAFEYMRERDGLAPITTAQKQKAAAKATPPGRWETYRYKDKTIILDGAHNPQKLGAMIESLQAAGVNRAAISQAAVLANLVQAPEAKITEALRVLQPVATRLIVPEFAAGQDLKSRRSLPAGDLAERARGLGFSHVSPQPDLKDALQSLLSSPEKTLLITGSLYLVSAIRPLVIRAEL
jgi:dihydrofolate synthase / folylpolyglutamate synthase